MGLRADTIGDIVFAMGRGAKIFKAAVQNPRGVSFSDLCRLAEAAGFELARARGSHHLYRRAGVVEIVNLQADGKSAKEYQVKQLLELIAKYQLELK